MLSSWSSADGGRGVEITSTSKMRSVVWSPLGVKVCLIVDLAVLDSTLGDTNICAASGLCPGDVVENSAEPFRRESDFLPTTPCPACAGDSRKSKPKLLLAFERLAFAFSPPRETSSEHPLRRRSADRVRDTVGGCAFTATSWQPRC